MAGFEEALKSYDEKFLNKKVIKIREKIEEKNEVLGIYLKNFEELEKNINSMATETAVTEILLYSVAARASDIHFQPGKEEVTLRLRIDGVLHNMLKIKQDSAKKMIMGIKYLAKMRSNISNIPQDGSMIRNVNGRDVDFRISTLPTTNSMESVVIRILDSSRGIQSFSDLGLSEHVEKKISEKLFL